VLRLVLVNALDFFKLTQPLLNFSFKKVGDYSNRVICLLYQAQKILMDVWAVENVEKVSQCLDS
jgi:hypothetical protein